MQKNLPTYLSPSTPPPLDHREAENPYLSLYGDFWEAKLKASSAVSKTYSIRELVAHAHTETNTSFARAMHAEIFFFYYDALTEMNDAATVEWK